LISSKDPDPGGQLITDPPDSDPQHRLFCFCLKENHETSKKHKENLERLIEEMQEEEKGMEETEHGENVDKETETKTNGQEGSALSGESGDDNGEIVKVQKGRSKKNKKKSKAAMFVAVSDSEEEKVEKKEVQVDILAHVSDDSDFESGRKPKKGKVKGKKKGNKSSKLDKNSAPESLVQEETLDVVEAAVKTEPEIVNVLKNSEELLPETEPDVSARADGNSSKRSTESKEMLHCAKCKAKFPSKNKLFDHLKSTGHAVYLGDKPDEVPAPTSKKSKKKSKK
jgi:DnaJ family protein A protein 5